MVVLIITAIGGTGLVIGSATAAYITRMLRRYRTAHARRDPVRNTTSFDINSGTTVEDLDTAFVDPTVRITVPAGAPVACQSTNDVRPAVQAISASKGRNDCKAMVVWHSEVPLLHSVGAALLHPIRNNNNIKPPADTTGRKLARVCGETVRMQLGFPTRSRANIVLCSQRCEAWLRENAPDLRHSMFSAVHKRAIIHALVPSAGEIQMSNDLNSAAAAEAEHQFNSQHWVKTRNVPDWIANIFHFWAPSQKDF